MCAKISSLCSSGDPELGPRHENGKWRALVGWNHQDDTEHGLKEGKVWCWVSGPPEKFQVYDQNFNRGGKGEVRFCGVANFTMVRMFHPYWSLTCSFGGSVRVPLDGVIQDKSQCREKYHQLIRRHRVSLNLPVGEDSDENDDHMVQTSGGSGSALSVEHEIEAHAKDVAHPAVVLPLEENVLGCASERPMIVDDEEAVGAGTARLSPTSGSQLVKLNAQDPYHRNTSSSNSLIIEQLAQRNTTRPDRRSLSRRNARSTSRARRESYSRSRSSPSKRVREFRCRDGSTSSSIKSEVDVDYPRLTDIFRQRKPPHSPAKLDTEQSSRCATVSDGDYNGEMDDSLFIPETDLMISPGINQVKDEDELENLRSVREGSGFSDLLKVGSCSTNPIEVD